VEDFHDGDKAFKSDRAAVFNRYFGNNHDFIIRLGGDQGDQFVTVTGNTTKDLDISFGSRVSIPAGSYNTVQCSQSLTTMGISCPY
jgi:uncharacterized protein YjlB